MERPEARFNLIYQECHQNWEHWCNDDKEQNVSFLEATKIETNPWYNASERRHDVDWSTTHAKINEDTYAHDYVDMGYDEIQRMSKAWLSNQYSFNDLDE